MIFLEYDLILLLFHRTGSNRGKIVNLVKTIDIN